MYTVGEIAKMMNISSNTLRYYDEIGLLRPEMVKEENQYRYYSKEQVNKLALIMELKEFGFKLREIKELLRKENNLHQLKLKFQEKQFDVVNKIEKLNKIKDLLQVRLDSINNDEIDMGKKSVMIVDDVEFIRSMQSQILADYGFMVIAMAENGEEAVKSYKKYKPDLVIMDIVMPKMDGIDALREIKEFDHNAKVIMCSGKNNIGVIRNTFENGAQGFVPKPFNPQNLIEELRNVIEVEECSKIDLDLFDKVTDQIDPRNKEAKMSYSSIKMLRSKIGSEDIKKVISEIIKGEETELNHRIFKEIEAEAQLLNKI